MAIQSWTATKVLTLQGPNLYFMPEIEAFFWWFIVCHKIPTLISWIFKSLLYLLDYFVHQVNVGTKLNHDKSVCTTGSKSVFYAWNWSVLLIIYCLSQNSYPNIMDFLKFILPFGLLWSLFVCHKIPTNQIWNLFFKVSFIFFNYVPHSNVLIVKPPIILHSVKENELWWRKIYNVCSTYDLPQLQMSSKALWSRIQFMYQPAFFCGFLKHGWK